MGAGSSIPEKRAKYVEYDSNNKLVERSVELSHADRYKTLARRDANGKVILGIHTNLFHKVRSRTGAAQGIRGNPTARKGQVWAQAVTSRDAQKAGRDRQRKLRMEESRPIVNHGNNIRAILSGLDSPGALDGALMSSPQGSSSRRRSRTLGLTGQDGSNSKSSRKSSRFGETKDDLPPGAQQRSAAQAAAAAVVASERKASLSKLSPSRRSNSSGESASTTDFKAATGTLQASSQPKPERLPIRIASDAQARAPLVNLQRRFGLEESYETSARSSSSESFSTLSPWAKIQLRLRKHRFKCTLSGTERRPSHSKSHCCS